RTLARGADPRRHRVLGCEPDRRIPVGAGHHEHRLRRADRVRVLTPCPTATDSKDACMRMYRTEGVVLDRTTRSGISGLSVEAWDAAGTNPDLIGFARTDSDGAFQISLTQDDADELF